MFEHRAQKEGRKDGQVDASLGRPRRPRPSLALSLVSERYRDEYLMHYKRAFDHQQLIEERAQANQLAKNARLVRGGELQIDKRFEQGWRDGYDGKDTPPAAKTHDELKAYERGRKLGSQHRDYERANQLRQNARDQNRTNAQGQSR